MDKELQKEYLFQRVVESILKKRKRVRGNPKKQSKHSRVYPLKIPTGESVQVCGQFFLVNLDFKKDIITTLFKKESSDRRPSIFSIPDKRRKHDPHHKMSQSMKDKTIQHIESYHPTVSHYRRAHAPLRKYLPSELTVTEMHKDFIQSHSQEKVSYESYRKILN